MLAMRIYVPQIEDQSADLLTTSAELLEHFGGGSMTAEAINAASAAHLGVTGLFAYLGVRRHMAEQRTSYTWETQLGRRSAQKA
jgi:hypothetical protein